MSRATASNFLNPHLRRRSKSGAFDPSMGSSSATPGSGGATQSAAPPPPPSSATKPKFGAMRNAAAGERQFLNRPVLGSGGSGTDDDSNSHGVSATAAAAGVAGRPRRMTQQATKLTIDAARAQASGGNGGKRVPATAIGLGSGHSGRFKSPGSRSNGDRSATATTNTTSASGSGRRFLRTPSNPDLRVANSGRNTDSSERDVTNTGTVRRTNVAVRQSIGDRDKDTATAMSRFQNGSKTAPTPGGPAGYGMHKQLQAKLETSSSNAGVSDSERPGGTAETRQRTRTIPVSSGRGAGGRSAVGAGGTKPQTWKSAQQQQQQGGLARGLSESKSTVGTMAQRNSAGPVTRFAVRETSAQSASRNKSSTEEDSDTKPIAPKARPTQHRPLNLTGARNQQSLSSSASAIGLGSYSASRPAPHRAGAAASMVGGVPPSTLSSQAPP
ncbi:hypothetical protein FBU59_005053, partial [Linderina macrospora]